MSLLELEETSTMNAARLAAIATAAIALVDASAQAQVFVADVKGRWFDSTPSGRDYQWHWYNEEDIFEALGAPQGSRLVMEYFGGGDQIVYVVDASGSFWGWFMYAIESSCATGLRESSTQTTRKELCVELISLYDSETINGTAICTIKSTFRENRDTLRKSCYIDAIDPRSGVPIALELTDGREMDFEPLGDE